MVTPLVSGSHLFAGLACCLARQWIHVYASLQRLLGYFTQVAREGGLEPCGPPGLKCLSLCNDRCRGPFGPFVVDNSGTAGFAGYGAPRAVFFDAMHAVFPLFVGRLRPLVSGSHLFRLVA